MCIIFKWSHLRLLAENPEDRATCNVNGKEYKEGDYFSIENDPDLTCTCQPDYKGKDNLRHDNSIVQWQIQIDITCIKYIRTNL